jgi:hypothetical protein
VNGFSQSCPIGLVTSSYLKGSDVYFELVKQKKKANVAAGLSVEPAPLAETLTMDIQSFSLLYML